MPLSPHEFDALARILRKSPDREARKPIVAAIADWLEATHGRKFRRPEWVAAALGPVPAFRPSNAPIANGVAHYPGSPKAKLFRAYEGPEKLGV